MAHWGVALSPGRLRFIASCTDLLPFRPIGLPPVPSVPRRWLLTVGFRVMHHVAMPYHGKRFSVVLSDEAYETLRVVAQLERKPVATVARSFLEEVLRPLAPVVKLFGEGGPTGPAAVALLQLAMAEMMSRTGKVFEEAAQALQALQEKVGEARD